MTPLHAWDVPNIDTAVRRTEDDNDLFRELAEVLKKHSALDRFGVTLLHKHFDIAADEALLETTDIAGRRQTLEIAKRSELSQRSAVETSWRLGPNGEALWGCVCVEIQGEHAGHRPTT